MPTTLHRSCRQCGTDITEIPVSYQRVGQCRDCYRARNATRTPRASASRRSVPRFGVEIEFTGISRDQLAVALTAAGIDAQVESYNHGVRRHWKITTDASVYGGGELVSPPLSGDEGREELRRVCAAATAAGARVNRSTGLHVHHEILTGTSQHTADSFARIFEFWAKNQQYVMQLVSASRRNSQWCRSLTPYDAENIRRAASSYGITPSVRRRARFGYDRYRNLNVCSFPRQGTIEYRAHQGSWNATKIIAWTDLGQAMIRLALTDVDVQDFGSLEGLLVTLVAHAGLEQTTANYLQQRAATLAGHSEGESPENLTREPASARYGTCSCGSPLRADGSCESL